MSEDLIINERITIPGFLIKLTAMRSSGPGGQNVNKVSTKIELRFSPAESCLFTQAVLDRIMKLAGTRVDSDGAIILSSQNFREQYRNICDVREKLRHLIQKALKPPKPRKPTKPSKASVERRIKKKKILSSKKAQRKADFDY